MTRKKRDHDELSAIHHYGLSISTREIFLHGSVSEAEDPGVDYQTFNHFVKNIRILETESLAPIIIHQYSIGGDWCAGMGIYDLIKNSPCNFIFLCHGYAASMGSIIPQAVYGKGLRISYPNCDWLIHDGSSSCTGTLRQMESLAKYNKYTATVSDAIYCEVCSNGSVFSNKTNNYVKKYIRDKLNKEEDWYLSSKEAVAHGFADGIFGSEEYPDLATIKGLVE